MDDFINKLRVLVSPKIPEELQKNTNIANTQLNVAKMSLYTEDIVSPSLINLNNR